MNTDLTPPPLNAYINLSYYRKHCMGANCGVIFFLNIMQSLPRSTSTDVANLLIRLNSIEVEIDYRKLIFFGQLCNLSYHYIIKEVFIHRLVNLESAAATQHEFIRDIYRIFGKYSLLTYLHILTSTKNASLIITDFLAVIKENEQRCNASLCRGWAMSENDFNLICR